jgi:hypothetical protein
MMPIVWFLVISIVSITVWRFIVHDKNNKKK